MNVIDELWKEYFRYNSIQCSCEDPHYMQQCHHLIMINLISFQSLQTVIFIS